MLNWSQCNQKNLRASQKKTACPTTAFGWVNLKKVVVPFLRKLRELKNRVANKFSIGKTAV